MSARAKFSNAAGFGAALLTMLMLSVLLAQPAAAADPDDWTYVVGSCDTNVGGIGDDLSGVTVDGNGNIWVVENGDGTLFQLTGTSGTTTVTPVGDPSQILFDIEPNGDRINYDTEGIAWIDSAVAPGGSGAYFAIAWEKDPTDSVESGMTIVEVVGNNLVLVAHVSLPNISNGTGNKGLEGIAFAPTESTATNWVFYGVKEDGPPQLHRIVYNVAAMTATSTLQGSIAVDDAAGIAIDPSDPAKGYVLTEDGPGNNAGDGDLVTEINLIDGTTAAGAGVLIPTGGGCFDQPEGLAFLPAAGNTVDLIVVGENDEFARFEIDYDTLVAIPAGCGISDCTAVSPVSLGAIDASTTDAIGGLDLRQIALAAVLLGAAATVVTQRRRFF